MTWPTVALGEIVARKSPSVDPRRFPDEVFELFSVPAHDRGEPDISSADMIGSSKISVKPRDVLLCRIVPHIRRSWVVTEKRVHRQIASSEWMVFRDQRLDPTFLRHFLVSDGFHRQFMTTVAGVGGSLLRARPSHAAAIRVPLPPLPEQRRIASILDEAQRVLELCKRSLLAGGILETALLVQLMSKAEKSKPPVRLDSVAETLTGPFGSALHRADYAAGGVPIVNPMHIVAGQINTSDDFAVGAEKASELTAYRLRVNDVVLGRRGELGRAAAVREEHLPALCGTGSMIVRPRLSNLPAAYLAGFLASPAIKRRLESQAQGATMLNLNQTIVGALPISVPSGEDLEEFEARVSELRKLKHSHSQRLRAQRQLAVTLQARAFRGEL